MNRAKTFNTEIAKTHPIETGYLKKQKNNNTAPLRSQIPRNKIHEIKIRNKEFNITKFQTRISTYDGNRNTTQARIKIEVVNSNIDRKTTSPVQK